MNPPFPSLETLRPHLPKSEPPAEWIALLGTAVVPSVASPGSWTPRPLEDATAAAPTPDLDALRAKAQEDGFCAGYLEGQSAGTERGFAEGRRAGWEEGVERGRQEVRAAQDDALEGFRAALEASAAEVGPAVDRWRESVEGRAADLAMDAVRALLAAELAIGRPDAMGIVREALGFAEGAVRAVVRLSPFDRAALAERREEMLAACAGLRDVELVDDRSIEGGCVVETEQGVVDATLPTRLSLLEAA